MSSLIHDLENNETILLMYLAEELPDVDRAEVEQMLASDPSLRAELQHLREAMGNFETALHRLDLADPVSSKRTASLRRVRGAVAQWQVDRLARNASSEPPKIEGYPWWVYGTSAAAVVVAGLLAWWGLMGEPAPSAVPTASGLENGRGPAFVQDFMPFATDGALASRWMMGVRPTHLGDFAGGGDDALDQVEREVVALSAERNDDVALFGAFRSDQDGEKPE